MSDFILEIGTEELPARFLPGLEEELKSKFNLILSDISLNYKEIKIYNTPRRAVVYITGLEDKSNISEKEVLGPPVRIAIGADGEPTRAGDGFAKTNAISFKDTYTVKNDKGEYIAAKITQGGEATKDILIRICPEIICGLAFPKRMRWGSGDFTFARPLRWIVALLDNEVIPFKIAEVTSGRSTRGHRVHGPGPFDIDSASSYFSTMKDKCKVVVSSEERRKTIIKDGNTLAAGVSGKIIWNEKLLDEVQGLCEHPVALLAGFDPSFLEIPKEVLLTSMESHQKSFGVADESGKLLPYFLTTLNTTPKDTSIVQRGWERVLRARLEDGRFFWKTDLKASFDTWLDRLDRVIFLAPLGSMGNKTRRISELAGWISEKLSSLPNAVNKADAMRAGRLSKADLVSEMVGEFDTLQGVMGGIYAKQKGENDIVAQGISEQYLPAGPDTPNPKSLCGAIVSIADKADTLSGCFGLNMIPTGTADQYALRRCALGISRIMLEFNMNFDVRDLFEKAFELYGPIKWKLDPKDALTKLTDFFMQRLKFQFTGQGFEAVLVDAVLSAGAVDICATYERVKALERFSKQPEFAEGVQTFKRAANIIRKQANDTSLDGKYDSALFKEDAERKLATELEKTLPLFEKLWKESKFDNLFAMLFTLKPYVDNFFDSVMVMCDDLELRKTRLNLLKYLVDAMTQLADFDSLQL